MKRMHRALIQGLIRSGLLATVQAELTKSPAIGSQNDSHYGPNQPVSIPPGNSAAILKRAFDLFVSVLGLLLLSPFLLLIALVVKLSDGGPVFYRQNRIGQFGVPFRIWKFRTMVPDADATGPSVTSHEDRRVTAVGRILRRTKLDEFPQLWNVLRGNMSLVGPRPEVPRYIAHYNEEQRAILNYKPGITDLASLGFRNEEALLRASEDMETFYIQQLLPRKLKLNQEYAQRANLLTDMWIVLQTVCPYWFGVLAVYAMILAASLWLSFALVYNSAATDWSGGLLGGQAMIIALQLACLLSRRHCKGLLCYFGLPEVRQIGMGLGLAALVLLGVSAITTPSWPPRNIILINLCLSLLFLGGFRLLLRLWRERAAGPGPESTTAPMRVGIVGAGSLGIQLARSLNVEKRFGRTAVAFFDDDVGKWQKRIHEIPVVGMPECVLQGWADKLDEIAIAMPNASPSRILEISRLFQKTKLRVYNVEWPVAAWGHSETGSNLAPV